MNFPNSILISIVFFTLAFGVGCILGSIVFFLGYMSGKKSLNVNEYIDGYEACLKVYEERLRYVSGNVKYWQDRYDEKSNEVKIKYEEGFSDCKNALNFKVTYYRDRAKYWSDKYIEVEALRIQDKLRKVKDE